MRIVPFTEMLNHARVHKYAVPALNVSNMETVQAITTAAELENSPLIVQLYHADLDYAGIDYMTALTKVAAKKSTVPISLSLDHGNSYEQAIKCIDGGFTGVMIDLSSDDFEENISTTKKVVSYAHMRGVSVEAELGKIFDANSDISVRNSGLTDPDMAEEFAKRTNIDALAVSIGTAHGIYSSKPKIDFDLVEKIVNKVNIPIVVHGGSNTPDEDIIEIVRLGVAKINIGTDLVLAYNEGLLEAFSESGKNIPLKTAMGIARDRVIEVARHKIRLLRTFAE
ncbi:class II fructose-bisphosphate aldolase [Vallitalea guaymasensis]|uniref:class II fructose-bisphosphate aldolase n=1 Tax=Vallitalea guaymasensis TaxID=1185412 RepID=UPI00235402D7|nr:class II fructose-bisphosphate aldolase [Vallitalea guaymasensis]